MIDGLYDVVARTPLGAKKGKLVLATEADTCTAELTVAGKTAHLQGTVDEQDMVTFTGDVKMPFPFGRVGFELVGTVEGDELSGTCRTKKFSFEVCGTRVS